MERFVDFLQKIRTSSNYDLKILLDKLIELKKKGVNLKSQNSPIDSNAIWVLINDRCNESIKRNDFQDALRQLNYALKISKIMGNSLITARFLIEIAKIEIDLALMKDAEMHLKKATYLLKDEESYSDLALLNLFKGIIGAQNGHFQDAEIYLNDALTYFRRINDKVGIAKTLNHLARVYFMMGMWAQSIKKLKMAIRYAMDIQNQELVCMFRRNLGIVFLISGNIEKAKREFEKYGDFIDETPQACRAALSVAFYYIHARDWERAESLLNQVQLIAEKYNFQRELATSLEFIGDIKIKRGEYDEAERILNRALQISKEIAPHSDLTSYIHLRLAEVYLAKGKIDEAERYVHIASKIARNSFDRHTFAILQRLLARISLTRKDIGRALDCYNKSIKILGELGEKFEKGQILLEVGNILIKMGEGKNLKKAESFLFQANEIFSALGSNYWKGRALIEIARLKKAENEIEKAFAFLDDAENEFKLAGERKALKEARRVRREFEKALVKEARKTTKNLLLATKLNEATKLSFDQLLIKLIKKVNAERGFVARKDKNGNFRPISCVNITRGDAEEIERALLSKRKTIKVGEITLSTKKANNKQLPNMLMVPFGRGPSLSGFLYIDRDHKKGPFKKTEITFTILYADNFQLKIESQEEEKLKTENLQLKRLLSEKASFSGIITQNYKMLEILEQVQLLANSDIPVLIEGETGTGKELLALALHYEGARRDKKFVAVNCAAIPKELFESELFGHEKGAFTGATDRKLGKFELAHGGTIFLDEVGDLDLTLQAKLLRVLDKHVFQRVGGEENIEVDVRVIAATNQDLTKKIKEGTFREDLYHRLKGARIKLPPLRQRKDDIPILVQYFLEKYGSQRERRYKISTEAMKILMDYDWPGNVRELENEIRKVIALLGESDLITPEILSQEIKQRIKTFREDTHKPDGGFFSYKEALVEALRKNNWVKRRAAKELGVPESTLRRWIRKYGIEETFEVNG